MAHIFSGTIGGGRLLGIGYLWVTLVPTARLVTVTLTGSWQKMFHESPRVGFLDSRCRRYRHPTRCC